MESPLHALYARLKARQISPDDAAEQLRLWKVQSQQGIESPTDTICETPTATASVASGELLETVLAALMQAACRVLMVDVRDLDGDVKLHEYGFDQVKMAELFSHLSATYGLALTPDLLREYPTLRSVATSMWKPTVRARTSGIRSKSPG